MGECARYPLLVKSFGTAYNIVDQYRAAYTPCSSYTFKSSASHNRNRDIIQLGATQCAKNRKCIELSAPICMTR